MNVQLIQDAMNGEQQAYTDLYNQAEKPVRITIYSIISPDTMDNPDADDLVIETMMKGFQSLGQLKNPESFVPWMKTIARNKAIDYLRKNKDVLFSDLDTEDASFEDTLESKDYSSRPDMVSDDNAKAELLRGMLKALPKEQRLVLVMSTYHQMTAGEIARELKCSEATVNSRLKYGRAKIEKMVNNLQKKQGIKLYSVSPALLLALFGSAERVLPVNTGLSNVFLSQMAGSATSIGAMGTTSGAASAGGTVSGTAGTAATSGTAAGTAAKTGAEAAAKPAAKAAAKAARMKLAAGVTAAAITVGGAGAGYMMTHRYQEGYITKPSQLTRNVLKETSGYIDEISEEMERDKKFYATGNLAKKTDTGDGIEVKTEYKGAYVLIPENNKGNKVYLIYEYDVYFPEYDETVTGYSYLKYDNVWMNKDGSYKNNFAKYQKPFAMAGFLGAGDCFAAEIDGNRHVFEGYASIEDFEKKYIEKLVGTGKYTSETTVKKK